MTTNAPDTNRARHELDQLMARAQAARTILTWEQPMEPKDHRMLHACIQWMQEHLLGLTETIGEPRASPTPFVDHDEWGDVGAPAATPDGRDPADPTRQVTPEEC